MLDPDPIRLHDLAVARTLESSARFAEKLCEVVTALAQRVEAQQEAIAALSNRIESVHRALGAHSEHLE